MKDPIFLFKDMNDKLEQQPSEDEKVIRIKKGTLKARTGRYVIYDVEWLKEHFNTTEAKLYGQPKERTETHACDKKGHWIYTGDDLNEGMLKCSECGFEHDVSENYSYCPDCGSYNGGRKE